MQKSWRGRYVSRIAQSVSSPGERSKRLFPYISVDLDQKRRRKTKAPQSKPIRVWYPLSFVRKGPSVKSKLANSAEKHIEQAQGRAKTMGRAYQALAKALGKGSANASAQSK